MSRSFDLSVYLVTDRPLCQGRDLLDIVGQAVRGGVSMVQLREKMADTREFVELARALKAMLAPQGVPLLINDRVDVALAAGADGVHVGQGDMHVLDVRRILGPRAILGLSTDTLEQVLEAEGLPVDYYGVGPVFPTSTKTDFSHQPWGIEGLRRLRPRISRPMVGIGGVDVGNAARIVSAGAEGVAVVSAICSAPSPKDAARALAKAVAIGRGS
ncbi:thiamine phosphate synthase [Desulfocurvibacter africanus]|uniref:thiamine phosphate synthase n=1 Tax=Desulfocurvibacter africanus TaxID=873 RepID=UPI002FD96E2C